MNHDYVICNTHNWFLHLNCFISTCLCRACSHQRLRLRFMLKKKSFNLADNPAIAVSKQISSRLGIVFRSDIKYISAQPWKTEYQRNMFGPLKQEESEQKRTRITLQIFFGICYCKYLLSYEFSNLLYFFKINMFLFFSNIFFLFNFSNKYFFIQYSLPKINMITEIKF